MKNYNWKQNLTTAIITILVTVIGGMTLYYLQFSKPKLEYSYDKILPFQGSEENLNIYHISIKNSGNEVSKEVVSHISIEPANIKSYQITSKTPISYSDTLIDNKLELNIKSLNPEESTKISIFGVSNSSFPDKPTIKVRADGVNGEISDPETDFNKNEPEMLLMLLTITAISVSFFFSIFKRLVGNVIDREGKHRDEQNQVIAYLCGIHGIDKQADRYLTINRRTSYWSEMDRLTSLGINSSNKEKAEKFKNVLIDLLDYAHIAESSRGIGYYNLARIEKFLGNKTASEDYLLKAKNLIPKLLEKRIKLDPIFS